MVSTCFNGGSRGDHIVDQEDAAGQRSTVPRTAQRRRLQRRPALALQLGRQEVEDCVDGFLLTVQRRRGVLHPGHLDLDEVLT